MTRPAPFPANTVVELFPDGAPDMYLQSQSLAREHHAARLAEAERERRQRVLARAARLSRKAEKAAYDARLALARIGA